MDSTDSSLITSAIAGIAGLVGGGGTVAFVQGMFNRRKLSAEARKIEADATKTLAEAKQLSGYPEVALAERTPIHDLLEIVSGLQRQVTSQMEMLSKYQDESASREQKFKDRIDALERKNEALEGEIADLRLARREDSATIFRLKTEMNRVETAAVVRGILDSVHTLEPETLDP